MNISRQRLPRFVILLKDSFWEGRRDEISRMGAGLAYYMLFSLVPLSVIIIGLSSIFFKGNFIQDAIVSYLTVQMGTTSAAVFQNAIIEAGELNFKVGGAVVAGLVFLYGSTNLFIHLQHSLNKILKAENPVEGRVAGFIRKRTTSIIFLFLISVLFIIGIIVSTGAAVFRTQFVSLLPVSLTPFTLYGIQILNMGVFLIVVSVLFALAYKFLPTAVISWKEAFLGASIASVLLLTVNFLISLYFGHSSLPVVYGVAGSVLVALVWMYYGAQVFFYGAEIAKLHPRIYPKR